MEGVDEDVDLVNWHRDSNIICGCVCLEGDCKWGWCFVYLWGFGVFFEFF